MRIKLLVATSLCCFGLVGVPEAGAVHPFQMRFMPQHFNPGFRAFVPPVNHFRFPNNGVHPSTVRLNNFIALNNFLATKPLNDQLLQNRAFNNLMRGVAPNNVNNFAQLPRNPIQNSIQPVAGTTAYINYTANPFYPQVNPWRVAPTWPSWPSYPWYPYPASYSYPASSYSGYSGAIGSYGGGVYAPSYGGGGYAPSYGGGYGGSYGSIPSYNPSYNPYGAMADAGAAAAPAAKGNAVPTLTAFAIPNDGGSVTWPLAFRLMNPDQKKDLLDKLEAQLQIVATQAAGGQANPRLLEQATQSVEKLDQWLRARRDQLAAGTMRDGEAFLRKLETALKAMGG